jgi:ADP-ribosylglycohydrolase
MLIMPDDVWEALRQAELTQLREEGKDLSDLEAPGTQERLTEDPCALWEVGPTLPFREGWRYEEPSDLEAIVAARPEAPPVFPVSRAVLPERLHGAWLGRCAGCMLGKPVEGASREHIRLLLEAVGEYPLRDYFPPIPSPAEGVRELPADSPLVRGNIRRAERDDDTDYPVVNLLIWQRHGPDFTPRQMADGWLTYLPYQQVYTAERAAYRNFVIGIDPPASAYLFNPYREWIGAQIRADLWGYVAPGQPALAAELAWRDACISHTRNGIYGEMFFAALIAAGLGTPDLAEALEAALATIPARSRFAEMVADCLAWYALDEDWERTCDRVQARYGHYHTVHTLNNAALVLIGLLYAQGDFSAAVGLAVQGGWDTDCNGATAGSVWGALHGAEAIPSAWTAPLNDTLISAVFGRGENRISALAEETAAAAAVLP